MMHMNDITNSPKSKAGRKPKYKDRVTHNVSMSKEAWNGLKRIANDLNLNYISELLEKIGKRKLKIKHQDNLEMDMYGFGFEDINIPTFIRLVSIYKSKNPLLRSITAAIYRYIDQLNLVESKEIQSKIRLMRKTLIETARVIELMKRLKPNYSPKSLPGLIVWISFQILFNLRKKRSQKDSQIAHVEQSKSIQQLEKQDINLGLWKIGYSMVQLSWSHPDSFRLLQTRFRYRKDYSIVVDYLSAHGQKVLRVSILEASINSRLNMRKIFHEIKDDEILNDYYEDIGNNMIDKIGGYPEKAREYYTLSGLKYITDEDHYKISSILQEASNDLYLDFWLNEIDHSIGHDLNIIEEWLYDNNHKLDDREKKLDIQEYDKSYSDLERKELENLDEEIKIEITKLKEDLLQKYKATDINDFENLIHRMITDIGDIDISSWFLKVHQHEVSSLFKNEISQLVDKFDNNQSKLKALLNQLGEAIDKNSTLSDAEKVTALEKVRVLALAGLAPQDSEISQMVRRAIGILQNITIGLSEGTELVRACNEILPELTTFFNLN